MKKTDVQIGATYLVKVAGNLVPVKITREHDNGGWEGASVKTGKTIRIKSPQRLRRCLDATSAPGAPRAKGGGEATKESKAATKRTTREHVAKGAKRASGLDAAARVLAEAGEPMGCKAMVETALAKGYWKTGGKTPAATIHAAIIREIAKKGETSRFVKTERGKFALAS